ncbi:MAG: hypothetical protein IJ200_03960 [Prevotella sp.]|nr:hypothetical protein [Prevotella sp.]
MKVHSAAICLILLLLSACHGGRRQQMLVVLDEADSLNRSYVPFTTDSQLLAATRFFDDHGSPFEQLRAHYLLGCAYRDLGQAPEALQAWHDAIDRADTTSSDSATLNRLMAVYGQMAELYNAHNLPDNMLVAMDEYEKYALHANDTEKYIRNIVMKASVYDIMGDTAQMLYTLERAKRLYESLGMTNEAVRTLAVPLYVNIERGRLEEARQQMLTYENQSGLFDEFKEIEKGRENYYYFKGRYFYKQLRLDSAEFYMRKLLSSAYTLNAYRGLMEVFRQKRQVDSVAKYSLLFERANDSIAALRRTEAVHRITALYNYKCVQLKTEKDISTSLRKLHFAERVLIILVGIVFASVYFFMRMKRKKTAEVNFLESELKESAKKVLETNDRLLKQQIAHNTFAEKKSGEIDLLKKTVERHEQRWGTVNLNEKREAFLNSSMVDSFHNKARGLKETSLPTKKMWACLISDFAQSMPAAYAALGGDKTCLSELELRTAILVHLLFHNNEIALLLNVSPQRISNIKNRVNKKLFNDMSASTLESNLKRAIDKLV